MAVADATVKSSPPPPQPQARIVVAVRAFLRFLLAPTLALARAVLVAGRALPYLCFAVAWLFSAIGAAMMGSRLTWGEGSASFVFLLALMEAAIKVCGTFILVALAAVLLCSRFLVEFGPEPRSEFEKSPFEEIMEESTRGMSRCLHVMALALVALLAFIMLIYAGVVVMLVSSLVEGSISQLGVTVGSVIVDVGLFVSLAISCFVICPAIVLSAWRKDQVEDRKEPSQFC